jgi:outer membrane receptor protein involved in Fe transport
MFKIYKLIIFLTILLVPTILTAQTGKVFGKVVDLETGEPLIGANVIIDGTSLGAATDFNGEYFILNVTPGTYTVRARFIGYREQINSNIKVYVNLTSEVNFVLPTEEYQTETIVVRAPKPLINKNITNSTSVVKAEDIENLPIRGVNAIVSTQAGVVQQGANIHVRGSRSDQVAFYVDGVLVTDPLFGGSRAGVINNAIEEIQVQAGGYSAEFGGANGGIISTQTRSGKEQYQLGMEVYTDNFGDLGTNYLDTYVYGLTEAVLTAGGPIIPSYKNLRFFLAGSGIVQQSPARYWEGMHYEDVYDPARGAAADTFDVIYPDGYRVNNKREVLALQGNITWDFNPFTVRLNGSFISTERRMGVGIEDIVREASAPLREEQTMSGSLKFTHVLGNNSFYDVIVNYFDDFWVNMDPVFRHNIVAYGDSIQNAGVNRQLQRDGSLLVPNRAFGFVDMQKSDAPFGNYEKRNYQTWGGKVNFLYQMGKHHEFKAGGDLQYITVRRYNLPNARAIASLSRSIADGNPNDIYNRVDNYGYDVYGNLSDESLEAAKHPLMAAVYAQDKMEFPDLVLNVGVRVDYIDIDGEVFTDPSNIEFNSDGEIDENSLEELTPETYVSPRIGVSFPVTDRTVFHAQYGKFVQQSRLRDVYQGYNVVADNIKGGFAIAAPVGFGVRPEKTTQYEIGFKQQLGEYFAFDLTGYYKDIKDQVQIRSIFADAEASHRQYYAWVNGDFATTKGVELKMTLRRTQRTAITFNYTYSDAQGTGSQPSTAFRSIWQSPTSDPFFPQSIAPLDFNRAHSGFANIDYRFAADDGPEVFGSKILAESGLNFLFTFTSGFNYTRWTGFGNARIPQESLNNSTTPWTYQIDMRLDKSFDVGDLRFNIYLWVVNLLNTRNIVNVFNTSGDARDDGYLADELGQSQYNSIKTQYGEEHADLMADLYRSFTYNQNNYGPPRQIRLGFKINY